MKIFPENDKQTLELNLEEWKYFSEGSDHLLLIHSGLQNQLLVFEVLKEVNVMQQRFNARYRYFLNTTPLAKFIKNTQILRLKQPSNELNQFLKSLTKKHKQNFNTIQFKLMENLFTQEWPTIIQIKPKSPLPDQYRPQTIERVAKQLSISSEKILQIIRNSPIHEKTRWFKKSLTQKLKNQNPLTIFGISATEEVPSFTSTKLHKKIHPSHSSEKINKMIYSILRDLPVLQEIYQIQSLYRESFVGLSFNRPEPCDLQDSLSYKYMYDINNLKQELEKTDCIDRGETPITDLQKWQKMFRFLISLSWRDISLILRFSLNLDSYELTIIDYDLKPLSKVEENVEKEESLLSLYIRQKIK